MDVPTPPGPLDYASPRLERLPKLSRRVVVGVLVADVTLCCAMVELAAAGLERLVPVIAMPLMVLNLPALPLTCLFAALFSQRDGPGEWTGAVRGPTMFACVAIVSSIAWGYLFRPRRAKRRR